MNERINSLFSIESDLIQKTGTLVNDNIMHHDYEMIGFEIREIKLSEDCIIFCYNDYKTLKSTYKNLKYKTSSQIQLKIIISLLDEYPFNLVVKFINRNKDIYQKGYIPKNIESDENRERQFLNNINGFNKIIYVGDVIKVV